MKSGIHSCKIAQEADHENNNFAGQNSLGPAFLSGMLLGATGYITPGIVTLRAQVLPLWAGLAPLFGFPLSVLLNTLGGGMLFGVAWLGVGYCLMKQPHGKTIATQLPDQP